MADSTEEPGAGLMHSIADTNGRKYDIQTQLVRRPATSNTTGIAATVNINSYPITAIPRATVYQYDVHVGSGVEKRPLIQRVWGSQTVSTATGPGWIFDGNKIAWSMRDLTNELTLIVDLDAESGRPARAGHSDRHRITIRKTNAVNLAAIGAYLEGRMSFDNSILEAINFLDHLMRETPSKKLFAMKRSFFHRATTSRATLGAAVEAVRGVYQSIRMAQGAKLVVNVDVSNSTFWMTHTLDVVAVNFTSSASAYDLSAKCKKMQKRSGGPFVESSTFRELKKLKKNKFKITHRGNLADEKVWTIKDFTDLTSRTYKFDMRVRDSDQVIPDVTIYDYFQRTYNRRLQYPDLPLVVTTKRNVVFPMELCHMEPLQRYPYKLGDVQTANMIRFAVSRPQQRLQAINQGLQLLDYQNDVYLKNYGLQISPTMLKSQARLLAPPSVGYANGKADPGYSGRWRLDGKKFLKPNPRSLVSWGVCILNNHRTRIDVPTAQNFMRQFMTIYQGHGGFIENKDPPIIIGPQDTAEAVEKIWTVAGNQRQTRPQILVFMLGSKDAWQYLRIKKSCECRFGVVSQCMQIVHVQKAQAQYISNVCMKFNAKLGGTTSRVIAKLKPNGHFTQATMIIGADVSHASPGSLQPSMAAITVSMDTYAARYAAACETNGHRVEMITTFNIENILTPLVRQWMHTVAAGQMARHVIYVRDGVSEGQYQHVIQEEVRDIKRVFEGIESPWKPKFTVIVASKRHHIRLFPTGKPAADNNQNPVPGVLVEKDVTHPFEWDFYLNSHSAIQGTARPTHYHVLMDEQGMSANDIQNMLYEQCYQYMRSTTPVSLFPAVYYAHIASNRARAHEDKAASHGPHQSDEERKEAERLARPQSQTSTDRPLTETKPLMEMINTTGIKWGMWYI